MRKHTSHAHPPEDIRKLSIRSGGWIFVLVLASLWIFAGELWRLSTAKPLVPAADYEVDINRATEMDLLNLPEVGPSLARSILRYRAEHGDFRELSEVGNVPGIGPQTLKQLTPFLSFSTSPNPVEDGHLTAQHRERNVP